MQVFHYSDSRKVLIRTAPQDVHTFAMLLYVTYSEKVDQNEVKINFEILPVSEEASTEFCKTFIIFFP